MKPKPVPTPKGLLGTSSEIRFEPEGVVLIIGPWNYPLLVINPLVSAIAAGNCAIIKPSELTSHTSRFLAEFLGQVFGPEEVAVFEGDARRHAEAALASLRSHFFHGSPRVGKIVMEAASRHLTSVTLELGGKSPVIIDESADLEKAAARITVGSSSTRARPVSRPLRACSRKEAGRVSRGAEGCDRARLRRNGAATQGLARLLSHHQRAQLQIVCASCSTSVKSGAAVVTGGEHDEATRYLSPTVLANVTHSTPIMKEEIFGPILPVVTYRTLGEIYAQLHAQGEEKPLALYIFSQDERRTEEILRNTTAGGTCVNQAILHLANPNLPFGGTGHSGMGSYHGIYGFRAFSHSRAVLRQGRLDTFKLLHPPYTPKVMKMIERVVRFLS